MFVSLYFLQQAGDIGQALEEVGQGNDTLSKFTEAAILRGVEISYEKYPSQTRAVLETLGRIVRIIVSRGSAGLLEN